MASLIAGAAAGIVASAEAQTVSTWAGGNGNWSNAAMWSAGVPNGPSFRAEVDGGKPVSSTVVVDGNYSVGQLFLTDVVEVGDGSTLTVDSSAGFPGAGSVLNSIRLNAGAGLARLTGAGNVVILNVTGAGSLQNNVIAATAGSAVVQPERAGQQPSSISGVGRVGEGAGNFSFSGMFTRGFGDTIINPGGRFEWTTTARATLQGGAHQLAGNGVFALNGSLSLFAGEGAPSSLTRSPTASLENFDASTRTLSGGSYRVAGGAGGNNPATVNLGTGPISVNNSKIELYGASSPATFVGLEALQSNPGTLRFSGQPFTSAGEFANSGTLTVAFTTFVASGAITNSGTLNIGRTNTDTAAPGVLQANAGFTQTAGYLVLGGTAQHEVRLDSPNGLVSIGGGRLDGGGTINGDVQNNGSISPYSGLGQYSRLTINGSLSLGEKSLLAFNVSPWPDATGLRQDSVHVAGAVSVGGDLQVYLPPFSEPANSDTFTILTAGAPITGSFRNVADGGRVGIAFRDGSFRVSYSGNSIVLSQFEPAPGPRQLQNISTRALVQTGENVLIGGFILDGGSRRVLIRAIGPSLGSAGLAGALQDPMLELRDSSGNLIRANDNWKDGQREEIESSGVAPSDDRESAIIDTLQYTYTAIVRGVNNASGVSVVELYDVSGSNWSGGGRFANISTRSFVSTEDNVMIGGFIVGPAGEGTARVIVRAIGPSLAQAGVTNALADPTLELRDSNGGLVEFNDNWQDQNASEIQATTVPPKADKEAAIVRTFSPGAYTAIVRGANSSVGVGLVEAYHLR